MKTIRHSAFVFFAGVLLAGWIWVAGIHPKSKSVELNQPVKQQVIQVEVDGAVLHPGVYFLDEDSRVLDALAAAGGFAAGADTHINLAAHLYNQQHLEIQHLDKSGTVIISKNTPSASIGNELMDIPSTAFVGTEVPAVPSANATSVSSMGSCSEEVIGSGVFIWPVDAHFLSGYDYLSNHPGIDLTAGMGSPVYAADAGSIRSEGNDNTGYGNVIEIDHGNGYSTAYAHLSMIEVQACQSVQAGQRIGLAGNTGNADGAHLHFEVIQDGVYIDPWSVLPEP